MKVLGIHQSIYINPTVNRQICNADKVCQTSYGVSFGLANSSPLRTLFKYGLPCMYSGVEMIDPRYAHRVINSGVFNKPSKQAIAALSGFEKNINGVEKRVFRLLKAQSKVHPEMTFQDILKSRAKVYQKRLLVKQKPIFEEMENYSKDLPADCKERFDDIMRNADDRLHDRPVVVPFDKSDFMYKLKKIKEDVEEIKTPKAAKVVALMEREAEKFSEVDSADNIKNQQDVIKFLETILKKSALKNYEPLQRLIESTKSKINCEPEIMPFSRKSFISSVKSLVQNVENEELREKMVNTARKLPTSRDTISAYVVKFRNEPSQKIAYRLISPFFASVEHIHPRSMGGADKMANYGGATIRENSERSNIDFTEQIKRRPKTKQYSQKYVNKLIELIKKGVFKKHCINPGYVDEFIHAVEEESKGKIKLNKKGITPFVAQN